MNLSASCCVRHCERSSGFFSSREYILWISPGGERFDTMMDGDLHIDERDSEAEGVICYTT
jgi:hypothetical protein